MTLSAWLDLFGRQDAASLGNYASAREEFEVLAALLHLGHDMQVVLGSELAIHYRTTASEDVISDAIRVNLLNSANASLVSATRLTLYGDHVDALALLRAAFDAVCHAEYFRHHPTEADAWDKLAQEPDDRMKARGLREFESKIRPWLEANDGTDRTKLYRELSSYGTHTNPSTVAMRLNRADAPNQGFVSQGKAQATTLVARWATSIALYGVEELIQAHPLVLNAYSKDASELRSRFENFNRDERLSLYK